MLSFQDGALPRWLRFKKILYHPLTLVALGIHVALILAPLNIGQLPPIARVLVALVLLLVSVLTILSWLWRTGQLSRPGWFKKILYHPLSWAAIGFHLLLLTVPFSTESSAVAEEAIAEEEAMPVDLLNLSAIATATPSPQQPAVSTAPPPASANASPSPAVPSTAVPSAAAPSAAPANNLPPSPVAPNVAVPAPIPSQASSQVYSQPQSQAQASAQSSAQASTQPPAYDPTEDRKVFIQGFDSIAAAGLNEYGELPTAELFPKGNAQYFLGASALAADYLNPARAGEPGSLPDGAATAKYTDKQPKDVLSQVQSSFASVGVSFTPIGEYGQEPLYELKKPTGETFAFVSLVGFQGSTLTVVWTQNPNGSSGT